MIHYIHIFVCNVVILACPSPSSLPPGLPRKSPPPTPNSPELELQSPVAVSKKPIPSANTSFELFKKQAMENAERVGVVSYSGSSFYVLVPMEVFFVTLDVHSSSPPLL